MSRPPILNDYAAYFQVGDVITIDNSDRPEWAAGCWRVTRVSVESVRLQPLNDDLTVDTTRDTTREYVIESGGLIERPIERRH